MPTRSLKLERELEFYNICFKIPKRQGARDLGITFSAGKQRPCHLSVNRFKNTRNRNNKIKSLTKVNRKAHVLFKGSSFSAMTFGHQACGIAPTNVARLQSDALAATGIGKGRCTFTSLVIFYGESSTPFARVISELITCWFKLLMNNKNDIHFDPKDLGESWQIAKRKMIASIYRQIHAHGILSNLIYTLF